jgi:hypothetical protein
MFSSNVWEMELYSFFKSFPRRSCDPDSLWISLSIDYLGREVLNVKIIPSIRAVFEIAFTFIDNGAVLCADMYI